MYDILYLLISGVNYMRKSLSLYIHIPFCMSKCHYCAFVSQVAGDELKNSYIDALLEEIKMRGKPIMQSMKCKQFISEEGLRQVCH